jgi:hypothetical protein
MKTALRILVVSLMAVAVSGCGPDMTLTVAPDHLPAGGGTVKVTYKTDGYLNNVPFVLTSNPTLTGFPVPWTGDTSGSITATVKTTTTFTLTQSGTPPAATSKTVSVN